MDQLTFKNIDYWYLVVIPLIILVVAYLGSRKKEVILSYLNIKQGPGFTLGRSLATVLAVALLFISFLGPQKEIGVTEIAGEGLDIYILMDTSKSMLATDIVPSRIEHMKAVVKSLIDDLDGHRIGFIPYASSAYIQMPLTDDYNLAKMFLNVVDTDMIGGGGTDLKDAVAIALKSFKEIQSPNQVILILSDGEEADTQSSDITDMVKDTDVKVYSVGIGTIDGSMIPIYNEAGQVVDYKKDQEGNTVLTQLEEDLLKEVAYSTGGKYYLSQQTLGEISALLADLNTLETSETTKRKIKTYDQLYPYTLAAGLVLLLIALKLPERRVMKS